jgi:septal ring factor EnvC (AmiA/AmiB activator)
MAAQSFMERVGGGKYWFSAGAFGTVCAWLFAVELPAIRTQSDAREVSAATREDKRTSDAREDKRDSLKHAMVSIEKFSETNIEFAKAITKNAEAIQELKFTLQEEQKKTRDNSSRIAEERIKKMQEIGKVE